jgi:hypothetical protein
MGERARGRRERERERRGEPWSPPRDSDESETNGVATNPETRGDGALRKPRTREPADTLRLRLGEHIHHRYEQQSWEEELPEQS